MHTPGRLCSKSRLRDDTLGRVKSSVAGYGNQRLVEFGPTSGARPKAVSERSELDLSPQILFMKIQ
jgi:hypothetical protein